MNVYVLFLTFILFNLVSGCTIEVLVKSNTAKSVFAQFTSPDGQKSPLWLFKKPTQNHRFQIKMDDCSKSPMVLETFEYNPVNGEKGKLIYSSKAFVNGNGYVDYIVSLCLPNPILVISGYQLNTLNNGWI